MNDKVKITSSIITLSTCIVVVVTQAISGNNIVTRDLLAPSKKNSY